MGICLVQFVSKLFCFFRLPPVLNKLKTEIYKNVDDQEKCFLLCKRYIRMMDRLFRQHEDPKYIRCLFNCDIKQVETLLEEVTVSLHAR